MWSVTFSEAMVTLKHHSGMIIISSIIDKSMLKTRPAVWQRDVWRTLDNPMKRRYEKAETPTLDRPAIQCRRWEHAHC